MMRTIKARFGPAVGDLVKEGEAFSSHGVVR